MSAKTILICAQAFLIQSALSQCINSFDGYGLAPYGLANGIGYNSLGYNNIGYPGYAGIAPSLEYTATSGGGLTVTSASPIPPIGITVSSDNAYEGYLSVAGEVPFVGTTGMEGVVQSVGAGAVNHACGNGVTAMANIGVVGPLSPIGVNSIGGLGVPLAGNVYGPGYSSCGYVL